MIQSDEKVARYMMKLNQYVEVRHVMAFILPATGGVMSMMVHKSSESLIPW